MMSIFVPLSVLKARTYSLNSAVNPMKAILRRLSNRVSRSQILTSLEVMGTASIPSLAATDLGLLQIQQNSQSGERLRRRQRMARSVLSFPEFNVPKWPKKLIFIDLSSVQR